MVAIVLAFVLIPRTHAGAIAPAGAQKRAASPPAARRPVVPHWGSAARAELKDLLHSALASGLNGAQAWSCVVLAQDGSVLFDERANSAVTPASAQKLIVADAAMTDLGKDFRFTTLLAAKEPIDGGTLKGDLWLAGAGDPSLRSDDLSVGVHALQTWGLRSLAGHVVVDPTAIAGEEINPLWNADDGNEDFMTATSGISLDGDTVEFEVTGTSAGAPAQVVMKPRSSAVSYTGAVITGGGDDVIVAAMQAPNQFRLSGNIPAGVTEKYWVPVHGMPHYAAVVLDALLSSRGIIARGNPITGTVPLDARVLWQHRSKPLPELVKHMLVYSDNHFAEQLMRSIGGLDGATPDDRDGVQAERHVLQAQGVPTPGLHLVDGSGLAHANRVAAITLARVLAHFDRNPASNPVLGLLPRGGLDGTLKMYHFTSAAGRVRAKSGHLDAASSLAGYVDTKMHGRVVFAFMINGSPGDPDAAIVAAVDRLAER
ncbi:MAG TPA: D-alanyl-D-alanine carboxypeptidase/D-alanyl-D-alanine-endopeptidase [Candidatus Baltobacteraceae bacterium]|nr:D-alanyl-D-alanine carboxypeptidase/D-alanyl-D-alanine-endopeptidase [Candidatus Baltobacteraceae bacterium]